VTHWSLFLFPVKEPPRPPGCHTGETPHPSTAKTDDGREGKRSGESRDVRSLVKSVATGNRGACLGSLIQLSYANPTETEPRLRSKVRRKSAVFATIGSITESSCGVDDPFSGHLRPTANPTTRNQGRRDTRGIPRTHATHAGETPKTVLGSEQGSPKYKSRGAF
jgi:hypothetical protein